MHKNAVMINRRAKKWIGGLVLVGVLTPSQVVVAEPLDVIGDLQKLRIKVCKELEKQDDKKVIKVLKETEGFIDEQVNRSGDPEFLRRAFIPATRKIELVYRAEKIRKPQINYIGDVYRAALASLRVEHRDEIRNQILVEKNSKPDFFENDCKRLKKK